MHFLSAAAAIALLGLTACSPSPDSAPNEKPVVEASQAAPRVMTDTAPASGADDALRPLSRLAVARAQSESHSTGVTVDNAEGLAAALKEARASGRPSLVLFTADWCAACAENEAAMEASGAVQARLQDFAVVRVDVTDNDPDAKAVMKDQRVVGPPTALLYDRMGAELPGLRSIGAIDLEVFQENLRRASGGSTRSSGGRFWPARRDG